MSGFLQALPHVLSSEGGYSDHPDDRGGSTYRGVTQATYDDFRESVDEFQRDVRLMEEEELQAIYYDYWIGAKCDALPWPVSLIQFDASVNHGPRNAVKILQRAVGVVDDGVFGPQTATATEAWYYTAHLINEMLLERVEFYRRIIAGNKSQRAFIAGWLARVHKLREVTRESRFSDMREAS